ncbi:EscU/YscU/HrcU family type III secretion system export apparatus switch protein [Providencia huaxiensis]|uniref:EscU/YscU/HrcU family type III secretion system export apparatus switch protein n=1 Tax=Providencia huaxiensis TaxID=2027290 RepID=UPI0034DD667E
MIRFAEKSGVPIVESIDLARALAKKTSVGHYIHPSLFEPVANILRMVMNLSYEKENPKNNRLTHSFNNTVYGANRLYYRKKRA